MEKADFNARIVTENLHRRATELSQGGNFGIKTALVVQGGGMRGTYSMAALMALEECGLGGAFDHVLGSSAGAINGAYLLGEQAALAVTVYLDDLSNNKFVNFFRLSKIVDIDYLVDDILKGKKALDIPKVRRSLSLLHIFVTDAETGQEVDITNRDEHLDLMEAIRATSALPLLYNRKIRVGLRSYIDGGLVDSLPIQKAIDLGCTDIVVVLTRLPGYRRDGIPIPFNFLTRAILRKNFPEIIARRCVEEDAFFNNAMKLIERRQELADRVRIVLVAPSDMNHMVTRTTKNRPELLRCALMGRNDMRRAMGLEEARDNPFD
jgi:predicted patatin/cPLA2 family phospholipase